VVQKHPELVDSYIVMNCPHSKVFAKQLRKDWGQLMKSWYMFMFQMPRLPELVIGLHDYRILGAMFCGRKSGVRNKAAFPPDVVEAYKYTFSQPGALTASINYHRCMFEQLEETRAYLRRNIDVPTLIIWGDDDLFLDRSMADSHTPIVTNLTVQHIPNCSHWVQQDAPDLVNKYMRKFLEN